MISKRFLPKLFEPTLKDNCKLLFIGRPPINFFNIIIQSCLNSWMKQSDGNQIKKIDWGSYSTIKKSFFILFLKAHTRLIITFNLLIFQQRKIPFMKINEKLQIKNDKIFLNNNNWVKIADFAVHKKAFFLCLSSD